MIYPLLHNILPYTGTHSTFAFFSQAGSFALSRRMIRLVGNRKSHGCPSGVSLPGAFSRSTISLIIGTYSGSFETLGTSPPIQILPKLRKYATAGPNPSLTGTSTLTDPALRNSVKSGSTPGSNTRFNQFSFRPQ